MFNNGLIYLPIIITGEQQLNFTEPKINMLISDGAPNFHTTFRVIYKQMVMDMTYQSHQASR